MLHVPIDCFLRLDFIVQLSRSVEMMLTMNGFVLFWNYFVVDDADNNIYFASGGCIFLLHNQSVNKKYIVS